MASEQVANLQAAPCEVLAAFVDELRAAAGEPFESRWREQVIARKGAGMKRLVHPDEGELRIAYEAMQLPDADDQRLIVCLPADERTAGALDRIAGRHPGAMRVLAAPA